MNTPDGFDAYAVTARSGPHVTLQAGVVHLGRHWTTTTRRSAKSVSINRSHRASATIEEGSQWRVFGGEASVLDPARLLSLAADPVATALAGGALLRLGLGRMDQLVGYAEAGTAVPLSFLPTGRVLLVTHIRNELVIEGDEVVSATGQWDRGATRIEPAAWPDRRWKPGAALADTPDEIVELAGRAGPGWLGVGTSSGAIALPATWEPATGQLRLSRPALAAVAADLPGPICVTLHDSDSRRPDEKVGVMLRGSGAIVDVDDTAASVALQIERVTYWCGFSSTTSGQAA